MKIYKKNILKNKTIKKISFIKSDLKKSKLNNKNFDRCDFWQANLKAVKFENSKFKNCVFTDSNLHKANFYNSKLTNVNLSHTNLKGANFQLAKFLNVNFRDAIYDHTTKWPKTFIPKNSEAIKYSKKNNKIIKKSKPKQNKLVKKIVNALTRGKGYYVVKNCFNENKIKKAFNILMKQVMKDKKIKSNLNNFSKDKKLCQKWIYNLLNLDPIFVDLIQPKLAMEVFKIILGEKFICGFFEANCLMPGARGQFPHIDYPYNYTYENGADIPFETKKNFLFNCQTLITLNDFNKSNGSTAFLEGSYKKVKFPNQTLNKKYKFKQIYAPRGSLVLFNGLTWHTSMPNYSYSANRFCILGQYLPSFIKPMLDIAGTTKKKVINKDKGLLKQLLGLNLQFPLKKY